MSQQTLIKLFSLSSTLAIVAVGGTALAADIPAVSTQVSLADTVLDRTPSASKPLFAQTTPDRSPSKKHDVGIGFKFGNSSSFGIDGKIGISDNFSLRPSLYFGHKPGVENQAGPLPIDIITTAPFTIAEPITLPSSFRTSAAITTSVPITVSGTTLPAGTSIPSGSTVPSGTVIPTGFTFPANFTLPRGLPVPAGLITNQNTGTAFGLAATYDFKLDEQGRSTAYIGPKIEFSNASGQVTIAGTPAPNTNVNINQTKIGLIAGADMEVSSDFTIGANVTFNLSNSTSGNVSIRNIVPGGADYSGSLNDFAQSKGGSSLDFGIRAAYRF